MTLLSTPVRDQLRAVTAEIHEALHHAAPFAAIAAGTLDRRGYGAVLFFLHRYHKGFGENCDQGARALGAPQLAAAHQARITALENDLAYLDLAPAAPLPPPPAKGVFAAGCLYTVQGSTLGGKVISRQLDYLLPAAKGRSFFMGESEDGASWRLLCAALEKQHADNLPELEKGALFAFARFRDLLEAT